jgi:hypothetical protein
LAWLPYALFANPKQRGVIMETFKKRQKAWARKEKQQKKAARKIERRSEKAKTPNENETDQSNPATAELDNRPAPTIL